MKKLGWLIKTEISQGLTYFALLLLITLILGSGFSLMLKAEQRISEISSEESWSADLAVVPKGITLIDFKKELLAGHSMALLPEALFDTTLSLSQGQMQATAMLALTDSQGPRVMVRGDVERTGTSWLKTKQKLSEWQPQTIYQTPEWGYKVITGFFVRGTSAAMNSLKELIDRKTVAQAILIQQQMQIDAETRLQLQKALSLYSGVMLSLVVLSMTLIYLWLKSRISMSLKIFNELGFSKTTMRNFILSLFGLFIVLPFLAGFVATHFFYTL